MNLRYSVGTEDWVRIYQCTILRRLTVAPNQEKNGQWFSALNADVEIIFSARVNLPKNLDDARYSPAYLSPNYSMIYLYDKLNWY